MINVKKYIIGGMLLALPSLVSGQQELNGFVEFGFAPKFTKNELLKQGRGASYSLAEQRVQLKLAHDADNGEMFIKVDFVSDQLLQKTSVNLREAWFSTSPTDWLDLKIGRQIQTWGVVDLLFVTSYRFWGTTCS